MKRGISSIVAMVLVVLVTVSITSIMWFGIYPMMRVDIQGFDSEVSVETGEGYSFFDPENESVSVQVLASGSKPVDYVQVIITLSNGTELISVHDAPNLNGRRRYTFNMSAYVGGDVSPISVSVAPIFSVDGKNILGRRARDVDLPKRDAKASDPDFYDGQEYLSPTENHSGDSSNDRNSSGGSSNGGGNLETCEDGAKNQDETGVDCGGVCAACYGASCTENSDCASGVCEGTCTFCQEISGSTTCVVGTNGACEWSSSFGCFKPGTLIFEVNNCRELNETGVEYRLVNNILNNSIFGDACINITASGVTFDCQDYSIESDEYKVGVYSDNRNTVIRNCNISMGAGSYDTYGVGIRLFSANNSYIYNNILSGQGHGLYLEQTSNTRVENNVLNSNMIYVYMAYWGVGIFWMGGENNEIVGNVVENNGGGIYLNRNNNTLVSGNRFFNSGSYDFTLMTCFDNQVNDNSFEQCATEQNACIYVSRSAYNLFDGNKLENSAKGVELRSSSIGNSSHNVFRDMVLTDIGGYAIEYSGGGHGGAGLNNSFINFSHSGIERMETGSELIRKWYYRVYVNDSVGNPISDAVIIVQDESGDPVWSGNTDSFGLTPVLELVDYVREGFSFYSSNNYTVSVDNGEAVLFHEVNLTSNNLYDYFEF